MIAAWKLPPLIAVIAVSIVGGFYLGGPGLGMAVGALAAGSIVVFAVRHPPRGPIWPAPLQDFRRHLLIVVDAPLEDPKAISRVAELGGIRATQLDDPEVRVLAITRRRFLDRWTSDRRRAYHQVNQSLVLSLASLARVGIAAEARIGDEDAVQAVEDELRVFPATDVFLITGASNGAAMDGAVSSALESRLRCNCWRIHAGARACSEGPRANEPTGVWQASSEIVRLMGIPPWPAAFMAAGSFLKPAHAGRDRRRESPS